MGMYTALSLGIELKQDTPQEVIDTLRFMIDGPTEEQMPAGLYRVSAAQQFRPHDIEHAFFDCDRWTLLFKSDSYYFDWQTHFKLRRDDLFESKPMYYLTGVSNLKNYSNEIHEFLDWLRPYIETEGFIGWTMYEENDGPTIIYHYDGELYFDESCPPARDRA